MTSRDEATAAVLGAVLLGESALDAALEERVRPTHFRNERERRIFEAMLELRDAGQPIDTLTVKARLEPETGVRPWTDAHDMRATVDTLVAAVPALGNLRGYCRIVREHGWFDRAQRQLYAAGEALERRDRDSLLAAISTLDAGDTPTVAGGDQVDRFIDWYESEQHGIPLPFSELTEGVGGGLQAGEGSILGGWPNMGKSLFAKDILLCAHQAGARCHDYANEQFGPRRTARLLSSMTGIPARRIRRKELTADEWSRLLPILAELQDRGVPYRTTPTPGWSAEDYARDMRRHKWDLALIDTVTNLPYGKVDEWDRAIGVLFDAAAQTGTHLLLLCQLNLSRDDGALRPPPVGRDLRSTGAWYQRAKVVMFVHGDQELREKIPVTLPEGHIRVDKANDRDDDGIGYLQVYRNPRWARFERLISVPGEMAA